MCSERVRILAPEEYARFHAGEQFGGERLLSAGDKSGTIYLMEKTYLPQLTIHY